MRQVAERSRRVLVVDDEESIREVAEVGLRHAGYGVAVASDGPEALRLVEQQPRFDLFVLDVLMPQMRGDELARRLRQRDADVKVLYFTGYPDLLFEDGKVLRGVAQHEVPRLCFLSREHEAFLTKPVSLKTLLESVSLLLFGHTHGPKRTHVTATGFG